MTTTMADPQAPEAPTRQEWDYASGTFRSLGSPIRIGIVVLLAARDRSVTELVDALGVSQPLVSQHLRVLRSSGLVRARRRGREMIYANSDADVTSFILGVTRRAQDGARLRIAG